jgi:hypothetical protein
MFTTANTLRIGRRMLGGVACLGMALGVTACSNDPTKLSCKDLASNPAAIDAMVKVAVSNPAFAAYINPSNGFGGGGQVAAGSGIDEGGVTTEFKNQVAALCAGANPGTQPFQTALGNTESFVQTGVRTPVPASNNTPEPSQNSGGSNNPANSNQPSGGTGGGSGSGQGSGGSGSQSSGSGGGGSEPAQHTPVCDPNEPHYPCSDPSSGQTLSGPPNSSGSGNGPVDNGSSSSGSSGSSSSGSGSSGSSGSGSSGSSSGSSQGNGNLTLPPCGPAQHCNW